MRFGAPRGGGGTHGRHFGLQLRKLGLPTLLFAGGSLSFFGLFIADCLGPFTPRRLQLGVELPALGFVVSFDTAPRTEPSALRRGSLAVFAILPQMSCLVTFETSSINICSMRRQTGFSYLNLFRRLLLTLEKTHGGLLFKQIDLNPLQSLEYKPQRGWLSHSQCYIAHQSLQLFIQYVVPMLDRLLLGDTVSSYNKPP
jgi:hypothetical protein